MATDLLAPRPQAAAQPAFLSRIATVPAGLVLAGIVTVSAVLRGALALAHATPLYFPDEYIYSALARSLATSGRPLIRGGEAHFPALLVPLVMAPFQLFNDPALAFRLSQGMNALVMSLAALPVYLLCRRLGLGKWFGLGAAAFTVACPDFFYVPFFLSEPLAYALVLAAVYAGVVALETASRRAQLAFLGFAFLSAFTRVQYIVVPLAFVAAMLVVEKGHPGRMVSRFRLSLGLLAAPVLLAAAAGPSRVLGYYSTVSSLHAHPGAFLHWLWTDALLLAYAAGWVLVPGALVGIAIALARPLDRVERAFAALTIALTGFTFLEVVLYAANAGDRANFKERYLEVLIPLFAPAFGLWVKRGAPHRAALAVLAFSMLALSARFPLSGWTDTAGRQDSPFLFGVSQLEGAVGFANGSLAVAGVVAALSISAVVVTFRMRQAAAVALGLSIAFFAAVGIGAFQVDHRTSHNARLTYLPQDARWVDHAGLGPVTVVQTPGAPRALALEQLFWNRSIDQVVRLRRADPVDVFPAPRLRVAPDGRLLVHGRPLDRTLLFTSYAMAAQLSGASRVGGTQLLELWRPEGQPRLSLLQGGRYYDHWLALDGYIRIWPDATRRVTGRLRFDVGLPPGVRPVTLRFKARGLLRRVTLHANEQRTLTFDVAAPAVWTLRFKASGGAYLTDGRAVSAQATSPTFRRTQPQPAATTY